MTGLSAGPVTGSSDAVLDKNFLTELSVGQSDLLADLLVDRVALPGVAGDRGHAAGGGPHVVAGDG